MAIDKKMLQQLINNPAQFKPDLEEEDIQDALAQKIEGGAEEPEPMLEDMEDDGMEEEAAPMGAPAQPAFQPSPEVMELMKKLKSPSPADAEVQEEVIDDATAPMELRKKAIQQIRQKYLGK